MADRCTCGCVRARHHPRGRYCLTHPASCAEFTLAPKVHAGDPPASHQAAATVAPRAKTDRARVHTALVSCGAVGLTSHEIDRMYGWATPSGSPAGKRLSELLRESPPRAVRLAETRRVEGGGPAHVHVAPDYVNGRETC